MWKEISQLLAKRKSLVMVDDCGVIVQRRVIKAFASRCGRASQWGVKFDKPLSDGSTGVVFSFIKKVL